MSTNRFICCDLLEFCELPLTNSCAMLMLMVVIECRGAANDHRKASKIISATSSSSATINQAKRAKIPYGYGKPLGSSIYSSWTINNPIQAALSKLFAKVKNNCMTRAPLYNMKKL